MTQPREIMPLRIRRADLVDLESLVDLENGVFSGDRLSRIQLRNHLDSDTALVLVARHQGQLLGDVVLFFRKNSRVARLYSLVTAPGMRGRGIGGRLVAAAEQAARTRMCREMRLEVRVDNRVAIKLYEDEGYQRFDRRQEYYHDGCDAWRYRKQLLS